MNIHRINALIMMKIASQDDKIAPDEWLLIKNVCDSFDNDELRAFFLEANRVPMRSLTDRVKSYSDRFIITMYAYTMAHIDQHIDARELSFFQRLLDQFNILPDDELMIEESFRDVRDGNGLTLRPRAQELLAESSFESFPNVFPSSE